MKIIGSYPKTRLRRLRKYRWLRNLISENNISQNDLILPIFVREGKNKIETIKTMPDVKRYTVDKLPSILKKVKSLKIPMVALFPYTPNRKKDNKGSEALNPNNLICKSLRMIKKKYPEIKKRNHACGLGKTFKSIQRTIPQVTPFLDFDSWLEAINNKIK